MSLATFYFALMKGVEFGENLTKPLIYLAVLVLCKAMVEYHDMRHVLLVPDVPRGKIEKSLKVVNEKFAQFCITVEKANGSSLLPHPPSNHHGDRERRHHMTYVISVKSWMIAHLSDYSTCPPSVWGPFPPDPGKSIHYGVDKIALAVKACLFEVFP
ncbi:hypothetical protein TNCV_963581 [Trichonephila clavipes]|nr:hypothetical protein TNCV_963581 [Trichonephila clavipes]